MVQFESFLYFVGGVFFGGLVSLAISHVYYKKAGRDNLDGLTKLSAELSVRNKISDFESLLESSSWKHTSINDREVWIANSDNTFQMFRGEKKRPFREKWTEVHPDKTSSVYPVYLQINNVTVEELSFVAVDCGRIFVPMPEVDYSEDSDPKYFWKSTSLPVKVCRIIGSYYIHDDLHGVAQASGIAIVD